MKTKSQQRSDQVFLRVSNYVSQADNEPFLRKYKGLCKRSGGMLRKMGLMQFVVYLQAKGQRPSEVQHRALLDHLRQSMTSLELTGSNNADQWIASIRGMPLPAYMRTTREVLQLLYWHKQIADVLIEGNADIHGEGD